MEAIALNYAHSAANSVLSRLQQALSNEFGLLDGVEDDIQFIIDELESIAGFLWGLSQYEELDKQAKTWMKQVKEMAYDAEDSIDEFARRIGKPWPGEELLIIGYPVHRVHLLWGWAPRHRIAIDLKNIKLRVEQVSQRRSRYDLKSVSAALGSVAAAFSDDSVHDDLRLTAVDVVDEDKLEDIEERSKELLEWLTKKDDVLGVASLVGAGGVGKTTLARHAYDNYQQLTGSNFQLRAWITVSKFPVKEVLRSMINALFTEQVMDLNKMETNEMVEQIRVHLQDKSYLLVLDDIWTSSAWSNIKSALHDNGHGSRIIVTTRLTPVARKCCQYSRNYLLHEVQTLNDDQSRKLLCRRVFGSSKDPMEDSREGSKEISQKEQKVGSLEDPKDDPKEAASEGPKEGAKEIMEEGPNNDRKEGSSEGLKDDTKEGGKERSKDGRKQDPKVYLKEEIELILKKCRGLPLAIVTVAAVLATKPKSKDVWINVRKRIGPELETNSSLEGMTKVLILSYNDLPYPLKPCFLFLSIFPEDFEIRRARLMRLWMAEGFTPRRRGMPADEVAEDYFNKLIDRNLIQPSKIGEDGNVKTCQVHDIMLEVVLSMVIEENFAIVINEHSVEIPHGRIRRLSVHDRSKFETEPDLSHIRSLYKFGNDVPLLDYNQMRLLRVLDLEGCKDISDKDLKYVSKMYLLKYLNLKGTLINVLPETISKLKNLQTLDIRETTIHKLPDGITELQNLAYFLAGKKYIDRRGLQFAFRVTGLEFPTGMTNLKALRTLQVISGNPRMLKELGELTNLRKLILSGETTEEARQHLITSIGKLNQSLRSLSIYDRASHSVSSLEHISSEKSSVNPPPPPQPSPLPPSPQTSPPPLMLQSLKLGGHLGKLPSWVPLLQEVAKITLIETRLENGCLQILQKLPRLVKLVLGWQAFYSEQLSFGREGFKTLKTLCLDDLGASFDKGALPMLELLVVKKYNDRSSSVISGVEFLPHLKKIDIDVSNFRIKYMLLTAAETHPKHPEIIVR